MIDYRTLKHSELAETIKSYGRSISLADDVLDGLLAVAVFHSIKDGQVTPAVNLLANCSRNMKGTVTQYLTKFGNVKWTKEKGLQYDRRKTEVQFGLEKANEVFESLPTLDEAFPNPEKQYRDIPFIQQLKRMVNKAKEIEAHGKHLIIAGDEEKELWDSIQHLVAVKA
jgi:hypothetical protein